LYQNKRDIKISFRLMIINKKIILIGFIGYVLINLIPVNRSNPPIKQSPKMPIKVENILRKSCYDCHSNEVTYPIYSYIAPASWIISGDVYNGRKHLNFSEWDESKEKKLKEEIWEEVEKGDMPLSLYTFFHPSAQLALNEIKVIEIWAKFETQLIPDSTSK